MATSNESESGILLAVEGIDGAGKTTQVAMLAELLRGAGLDVVTSKEPTNGRWGQQIRKSAESGRLPPGKELNAFILDRQQHVAKKIQPSLDKGMVVILDRYFFSTIAYQGERGLSVEWLDKQLRDLAPIPDMVIVLDVHPIQGLTRIIEERGDTPNHFERQEKLERIREIFKELCLIDPNLVEIDGSMSVEAVHAVIVGKLLRGPLKKKLCAKTYGCDDPVNCGPRILGTCTWAKLYKSLLDGIEEPYRGLAKVI